MMKLFYLSLSSSPRRPRGGHDVLGCRGQPDRSLPFMGSRLQRLRDHRLGGWAPPRGRGQRGPGLGEGIPRKCVQTETQRMRTPSQGKGRGTLRVGP